MNNNQNNILIKYYIILIFLAANAVSIYSQAPIGEKRSVVYTKDGDTLVINSKYPDFLFGLVGGFNLVNNFGDLNVPTIPGEPNNPFNRIITFNEASGKGYFVGGIIEWNPTGEKWGARLTFNFFDSRDFETELVPTPDSVKSRYSVSSTYRQFTISPGVKYNLPIEGLHIFAGLNFELLRNDNSRQIYNFNNPEPIEWVNKLKFNQYEIGYGVNFGIGYDLLSADINGKYTAMISPYAEIQFRSNLFGDLNSNWNSIISKFGFQFKIGADKTQIDTLFFDPTYVPPATFFATAKSKEDINVSIKLNFATYGDEIEISSIDYIPLEKNESEVVGGELSLGEKKETGEKVVIGAQVPDKKTVETVKEKPLSPERIKEIKDIILKKGITQRFSYPSSDYTDIPADFKLYLDKIINFMKNNPNAVVLVIGHSDNVGTTQQIAQRAMMRAKKVESYLIKNGANPNNVKATWKGALYARQSNDTDQGRLANRRVEITIQE